MQSKLGNLLFEPRGNYLKILLTFFWLGFHGPQLNPRIISLAPSLTESVCALELCDRLVGVTSHCTFPPEVSKITKVGGYLQPNLEKILSLEPDLVLVLPEHRDSARRMAELGLKVETLKNYSIEDIRESLLEIGRLTGHLERAEKAVETLLARQFELTKNRQPPVRCLMVLGHGGGLTEIQDIYAVGKKGFLNELLELAGGENVVPQQQAYFPKLSREAMIALDPEVIIELIPEADFSQEQRKKRLQSWQSLSHLKAVQDHRVHLLVEEHVLQSGPRYPNTLAQISSFLEKP